MNEKLGPCPLCGALAETAWEGDERVRCSNVHCSMPDSDEIGMWSKTWNQLSALAANERRMREELELMDLFAKEHAEMAVHERDLDAADDWEWIRGRCREALKGGEG